MLRAHIHGLHWTIKQAAFFLSMKQTAYNITLTNKYWSAHMSHVKHNISKVVQ